MIRAWSDRHVSAPRPLDGSPARVYAWGKTAQYVSLLLSFRVNKALLALHAVAFCGSPVPVARVHGTFAQLRPAGAVRRPHQGRRGNPRQHGEGFGRLLHAVLHHLRGLGVGDAGCRPHERPLPAAPAADRRQCEALPAEGFLHRRRPEHPLLRQRLHPF